MPTAPPPRVSAVLNDIDANLPAGFEVHLVMDNYGTHKVNHVGAWFRATRVTTSTSHRPVAVG